MLTSNELDWTKPLQKGGPTDLGFESSLMSLSGIQDGPYLFLRDGKFEDLSNIKNWKAGTYSMPEGSSIVPRPSEGSFEWDSTAFNMIQVNETARFLDDHIKNRPNDPFFAYIALGNVHIPHSPPDVYLDGSIVAGKYNSSHMDLLGEMDKVVGSIVQHLDDRDLLGDTIVIFTSDNGGLGPKYSEQFGHNSHGPLRGAKGQIYEGGHRIPFMMRWDNGPIPAGATRSRLLGLNDLFATLCQLVGVEVPKGQAIDSVSFADYIENEENTQNLRETLGVWAMKMGLLREESLRKNNLKLIRQRHSGQMFLYDLDKDISETKNLINEDIYKDTVSEMMAELKDIGPCYDNQGTFSIVNGGSTQQTTCAWFGQDPSRCRAHYGGQIECRLTCAGRSSSACDSYPSKPTSSPSEQSQGTAKPSTMSLNGSCNDSTLRFKVLKDQKFIRKDCTWVSSKDIDNRCNLPTVSSMCPDTCNNCRNCVDSTGTFKIEFRGIIMYKDCIWIRSRQIKQRCALPGVSETCSATCDPSC